MKTEIGIGFVEIIGQLGDDSTIVNSARVSFGKRITELEEKDKKLLKYLADNKHHSPFRHCYVQLHIKAPEFVARQAYKHMVGTEYAFKDQPWNEISGRYVEMEQEFWRPDTFRSQSASNKQASVDGSVIANNAEMVELYNKAIDNSYAVYEELLANGVAKEQARAVLPVCFYTEWYWTASLQALSHFADLRGHSHAQKEIRDFAQAIDTMLSQLYPVGWEAIRNRI